MAGYAKIGKARLVQKNVRKLLNSKEVQAAGHRVGSQVAARAGAGYAADTQAGQVRSQTRIKPVTTAARVDNYRNNTLLKASGRQ